MLPILVAAEVEMNSLRGEAQLLEESREDLNGIQTGVEITEFELTQGGQFATLRSLSISCFDPLFSLPVQKPYVYSTVDGK